MNRLKSRQRQVPNGLTFRQPQIKWDSRKALGLHPSFDTLVNAVLSARKANSGQSAQHKLSLDRATVEMEVEMYNVKVCLANGWLDYLTDSGGGQSVPLAQSRSPEDQKLLDVAAKSARRLWSGVKITSDWKDSGEPPVSKELAESRAATCVACPLNGQGDLTKWFTIPASAAIKRQLEWLSGQKLVTSVDDKLNICEACLCPLKLKSWTPFKFIKAHLAPDVIDELRKGRDCWQLKELEAV
jgi:hypothetical protein